VAAVCGAAAVICVALTAWRPALGLLGILVLACVVLKINPRGLRSHVPLLRSANPAHVTGGWLLIGCLVLFSLVLAVRPPGAPSTAGAHTARHIPPSAPLGGPTAVPGTTTPSPVAPTPSAEASPSPSPTPSPTRIPTSRPAPAATAVTFLNAPLSSRGGQIVTLFVRTNPDTACSIEVGYPQPPPGLDPAMSSRTGDVSWTWRVSRQAPPGSYPITVSCGRAAATTQITLT